MFSPYILLRSSDYDTKNHKVLLNKSWYISLTRRDGYRADKKEYEEWPISLAAQHPKLIPSVNPYIPDLEPIRQSDIGPAGLSVAGSVELFKLAGFHRSFTGRFITFSNAKTERFSSFSPVFMTSSTQKCKLTHCN